MNIAHDPAVLFRGCEYYDVEPDDEEHMLRDGLNFRMDLRLEAERKTHPNLVVAHRSIVREGNRLISTMVLTRPPENKA